MAGRFNIIGRLLDYAETLWRLGGIAKKRYGVSRWRMFKEHMALRKLTRLRLQEYFMYDLCDPAMPWERKSEYMGHALMRPLWSALNPIEYRYIFKNKLIFKHLCRAKGLPAASLLGVFDPDYGEDASGNPLSTSQDLSRWAEENEGTDFVAKPAEGAEGQMILSLRARPDGDYAFESVDGKGWEARQLYDYLTDQDCNESIEEWVNLINQFSFVGVRGPLSAHILRDCGVTVDINVVGDPCLLLAPAPQDVDSRIVGINFGKAIGPVFGNAEEHTKRELATCMAQMHARGWRLRLLVVRPEDYRACRELVERSKVPPQDVSLYCEYNSPRNFMSEAKKCSVFIDYKLHATALAMTTGVPSIMLAYRPKCDDFMRSLDCADWCLHLPEVDAEILSAKVEEAYKQRHELSRKIRQECLNYRKKFRNVVQCFLAEQKCRSLGKTAAIK